MSTVQALPSYVRATNYLSQTGRDLGRRELFTPAQSRRIRHKENRAARIERDNEARKAAMERHPAGKSMDFVTVTPHDSDIFEVATCATCGVPVEGSQKCQTKSGNDAPKSHADRLRKMGLID